MVIPEFMVLGQLLKNLQLLEHWRVSCLNWWDLIVKKLLIPTGNVKKVAQRKYLVSGYIAKLAFLIPTPLICMISRELC